MKPISYTTHPPRFTWSESPIYVFHYSFAQLRKFLTHGHTEGNNGFILVSYDGQFKKLRGFGTIENPSTTLRTFNFMHHESFEGKFDVEEIMNPTPKNWFSNVSILIPKGRI